MCVLASFSSLLSHVCPGGAGFRLRASLHREGLFFPPFPFNHSIETEGLAKVAIEMGAQPYGQGLAQVT